jgi:DNA-binding transcriptional LysR family regulator
MLDELYVFLKIVESNSFAETARMLKLSSATVARKLARLEATMEVKLIERNTRALSLTKAGQHCYDRCQSIPLIIEEMMNTFSKSKSALNGTLNISVATYSGYHEVLTKLVQFNQQFPNIILNITKSNIYPTLIDDSYDAYIRYSEVNTRSLKSVVLTEHQMCVCASERYLLESAPVETPADLNQHRCIVHQVNRHEGDEWEFQIDGQTEFIRIKGDFVLNNSAMVLETLIAGGGIAYMPTYFIENESSVKTLLHSYWPAAKNVYLTYPRSKHLFEKTKVFVEFMQTAYAEMSVSNS